MALVRMTKFKRDLRPSVRHLVKRFLLSKIRQNFSKECEDAINEQINRELTASHRYLAMAYNCDRVDVALPGAFLFFKNASDEEREHAGKFMEYLNKRGGQIKLDSIPAPKYKFECLKEALTEAFDMEVEMNECILKLHALASKANDPSLGGFLESYFLTEQVDAQKVLAAYIRQIERSEQDLGSFLFDLNLTKNSKMHK